jgi:serine protease Do
MDGTPTRRTFLASSGAVVALGSAGAVTAQSEDCQSAGTLADEVARKEDRLASLQSERQRLETEQIPALESETAAAIERWRDQQHRYDEATLTSAKETGIEMRDSIVQLRVEYAGGPSFDLSTAWYAREDLLLTNSHNVSGYTSADVIRAETVDGDTFECSLINREETNNPDVALLRPDQSGSPLPTGEASNRQKGDRIVQVGHPGDLGNWVITLGEILSFTDVTGMESETEFQASTPGMKGSSGSPVATLDGTVVGMLYSGRTPSTQQQQGPPEPATPTVRTEPLPQETTGGVYVAVEKALRLLEEWT